MNSQAVYNVADVDCTPNGLSSSFHQPHVTETRQLGGCWLLERRCCVRDLVALEWYCNPISISIRLCVSSCPNHLRNKGFTGERNWRSLKPLSYSSPVPRVSVFSGVDGGERGSWCRAWKHHPETLWIITAASPQPCRSEKRLDIFNLRHPSGYLDCKLLLWTAEYAGEVNITIMFSLIRQC